MKLRCNCTHVGQDALHGKGVRVHNKVTKTTGNREVYKCTVCGKEHVV